VKHFRWYDRDGNEITQRQADILAADPKYGRVATYEEGEHYVSTVWCGSDQAYYPARADGLPVLFETVIWGLNGSEWSQTYASEISALAGHDQAVMRLRCEILPEASR
jgi:hypothetical protein